MFQCSYTIYERVSCKFEVVQVSIGEDLTLLQVKISVLFFKVFGSDRILFFNDLRAILGTMRAGPSILTLGHFSQVGTALHRLHASLIISPCSLIHTTALH